MLPLLPISNVSTAAIKAMYKTYINIRRYGNRSARPASIADGVPSASETGEPEPLFSLQVKGWRQSARRSTSDRQSRPSFREVYKTQIGVKNLFRSKIRSQNPKKRLFPAVLREERLVSKAKKINKNCNTREVQK